MPASVRKSTEAYRLESDSLADFLADRCVVRPDCQVRAGTLYDAYVRWAEEQKMRERNRFSSTKFGRDVSKRFDKQRTTGGSIYLGVGLLNDGFA